MLSPARAQVRFIRIQIALTPAFSKFMEIQEINESVGHEMSPVQAAYVFKALVELKLVSPDKSDCLRGQALQLAHE